MSSPFDELDAEMRRREREHWRDAERAPLDHVHRVRERNTAVTRLRREAQRDEVYRQMERTNRLLADFDAEVSERAAMARAHELLDD
jgi:hypothetical protein